MGVSYPHKDADRYNRPVELIEMWAKCPPSSPLLWWNERRYHRRQ